METYFHEILISDNFVTEAGTYRKISDTVAIEIDTTSYDLFQHTTVVTKVVP